MTRTSWKTTSSTGSNNRFPDPGSDDVNTTTLYEFLVDSGAEVQVYDLGRRIGAITGDDFLAFERGRTAYPSPMQHKAWLALVQLPDTQPASPIIWFLRLDLDEQGLLVQAERDYLLSRLAESARANVQGEDPQVFLRDNPYAFTPRDDRMALFHALLSTRLGLPPSRHYDHALDYFSGGPGWDQWEFVGYQGIADVACRHSAEPLIAALPRLPKQPLIALCHCLESTRPSTALADALTERLDGALADPEPDVPLIAALIRGCAAIADQAAFRQRLRNMIEDHPAGGDIEILAAIAGRAWESLADRALLDPYLHRLATNEHGQAAFEHCLGDLLRLPRLAAGIRQALRSRDQSVEVRAAFGRMAADRSAPDPD